MAVFTTVDVYLPSRSSQVEPSLPLCPLTPLQFTFVARRWSLQLVCALVFSSPCDRLVTSTSEHFQ